METQIESLELISRKRERALSDEPERPDDLILAKRTCKEWPSEGVFSELFCKDEAHEDAAFTGENFDPVQEEMISDVIKSLEEEIRCSESRKHHEVAFVENTVLDKEESSSVSDSASSVSGSVNITVNENSSNIDIEYLLGATDDELGIPPSPQSDLISFAQQENGDIFENSVGNLFDNFRVENEAEELLQLCRSDCWYPTEEQDIGLFNDAVCQDWVARTLSGDLANESSSMDQTLMPLLEAGVGM
eukprot:Gb_00528 [translate_table: standard]